MGHLTHTLIPHSYIHVTWAWQVEGDSATVVTGAGDLVYLRRREDELTTGPALPLASRLALLQGK